jgi:hypothetical protein
VTHTISTTMRPGDPIQVGDAEYLDLKRQGLIAVDYDEQAATQTPPATAERTATIKKAAPSATSKED